MLLLPCGVQTRQTYYADQQTVQQTDVNLTKGFLKLGDLRDKLFVKYQSFYQYTVYLTADSGKQEYFTAN